MDTEDHSDSGHRGPEELWIQRTRATVGTEDQRSSGYRGPEEQWVQRTRGTVGTEDQRNSGHRGPEEQRVQRTRGTSEMTKRLLDVIPSRRHELVSTQSLNCFFLYSKWRKMGSFLGFRLPITKRRNKESHFFLGETSFLRETSVSGQRSRWTCFFDGHQSS